MVTRHALARIALVNLALLGALAFGCKPEPRGSDAGASTPAASPLAALPTQTPRAQAQTPPPAQPEQQRAPSAGMDCFTHAYDLLQLADQTAYNLCIGAASVAPAECFSAARAQIQLTDPQTVALCRCTTSNGPVDCFAEGRARGKLTDDQLIGLCSAMVTQQLRAGDCSNRSY